jgi:hypothetical protein
LFAFNQALKFLKDKEGSIYTDSKYAFGVAHTFGNILLEINSKGQDLIHEELIIKLVESPMLPKEIAIVHVSGHQQINFLIC